MRRETSTGMYFGYEKGTYTIEGNQIRFAQRQHSREFKSTCNPSLNSNKKLPLDQSKLTEVPVVLQPRSVRPRMVPFEVEK